MPVPVPVPPPVAAPLSARCFDPVPLDLFVAVWVLFRRGLFGATICSIWLFLAPFPRRICPFLPRLLDLLPLLFRWLVDWGSRLYLARVVTCFYPAHLFGRSLSRSSSREGFHFYCVCLSLCGIRGSSSCFFPPSVNCERSRILPRPVSPLQMRSGATGAAEVWSA